ncbi:glycoside hydrolase family 43 protein [Cognatishimia activa]|uniref:Beta-xylosidase n=1 Tax=Cognatishimia activa TaxID=1715691 RepID=A0A0P1IML2_9RHOB|nr:glycoside hydrolase family 43 protein [Cognatishimia activa]CUI32869.1 Beta-xylosidase [Cognatishimia activa]CUK24797.1 Beta-xylosidase [Cognatishimia activa]
MTQAIRNPILPGFHPDPSICRVGEDVYIATSTFEWYPGVEINHSTDMVTWSLVARPLDRKTQLDMRGNPDSCGVWAPCLSYADGLFWLIYTDVKRYDGNYKDTHNYLVTAPSIEGPWSDPVHMNSSGFDPSLFHDADGRKWFVNMDWDYRAETGPHPGGAFSGIVLQEYDPKAEKLVGPITRIFEGTDLGYTEAPHLLQANGYYYLCTAEGGTGYNHAVTYARAERIEGPYEVHPDRYVLTAKDTPQAPLQRIGHGQFVETTDGQGWHTFLCGRPLPGLDGVKRSPLGRETGIVQCAWGEDGWLYCDDPQENVATDGYFEDAKTYAFEEALDGDFQWLRTPERDRIFSLTDRPGYLRLIGRESVGSWFEQALVARRQTSWNYSAETALDFSPRDAKTMAGLVAYYNRHQFHYLYVYADLEGTARLAIQSCDGDWPEARLTFPAGKGVALPAGALELGVDVDGAELQFRWRVDAADWQEIGPKLDASVLSDEAGRGDQANFTGAFVGMAAQDTSGQAHVADFNRFTYENRKG